MALILVEKDGKNRVAKEVTTDQRTAIMAKSRIWDVGAAGVITAGPFGPTNPDPVPVPAAGITNDGATDTVALGISGAKSRKIASIKPGGGMSAAASAFTFACTIDVPFTYTGARIRLLNGNGAALTGVTAAIGGLANRGSTWSAPTSLVAFTDDTNVSTFTVPAGSGTFPATGIYGSAIGYAAHSTVPRTDGRPGSLIHVRVSTPVANANDSRFTNFVSASSTLTEDGIVCGYATEGNSNNLGASFTQFSATAAFALDLFATSDLKDVMYIGDSTRQGFGYGAGLEHTSGMTLAVNQLVAGGTPIALANYGHGSMRSEAYTANGLLAIAHHRPSIAVYQVGSVNDQIAYGSGWLFRSMLLAEDFVRTCRQYGVVPALVTMNPRDGIGAANEAARQALLAAQAAFADANRVVNINTSTTLTLAGVNGGYAAGLSTDGTHLNSTGYAAESAILKSEIAKMVANL